MGAGCSLGSQARNLISRSRTAGYGMIPRKEMRIVVPIEIGKTKTSKVAKLTLQRKPQVENRFK